MSQHHNARRFALLLQIIVVTRFGFVFLRVLATSSMWGIERFTPLDMRYIAINIPLSMLIVGLGPWLLLKYIHTSHLASWWYGITIGLAFFRILEQINHNVIGDYFLAAGGVSLFIAYFSVLYQATRSYQWVQGDIIAIGIAIAVMLDTALRGVLWTLDLSWQQGLWPLGIVATLSMLLIGLSFATIPRYKQQPIPTNHPKAWGIFLVSFYFFLIQHLYGDISRMIQRTGWTLEISLLLLLIGNFLAILGAYWVSTHYRRKSLYFLPWLFLLGSIFITLNSGWNYVVTLYTVEVTGCIMMVIVLKNIFSRTSDSNLSPINTVHIRKVYPLSFFTYVTLVVLFYITGMSDLVFIFIGLLVSIIFWKSVSNKSFQPDFIPLPKKVWRIIITALLLLIVIAPLSVKFNPTVLSSTPLSNKNITIMQWNIHQGISADGELAIQEQAAVIREQNVDIVSLNEVGRGALWSGSMDTLLWLSHNLGMYTAYGATVGTMSGNAFLSKQPFDNVESLIYSQESIVPSGCTMVDVFTNGQNLQLASTHVIFSKAYLIKKDFKDRNDETAPERINIFRNLIDTCVDASIPFLLLGDMNATPDLKAIETLQTAGLTDAVEYNTSEQIGTWANSSQRIDYVFGSPQVNLESYQVIRGSWSDHFPIIVSLSLNNTAVTE